MSTICISCKKSLVNDHGQVTFACPKCTSYQMIRCSNCRSNAVQYACPGCGFTGPN